MHSSYRTVSSGSARRIREWRLLRRMQHVHARFDAFVVSIPKAGRTWHRLMLGYYLTRLIDGDLRNALKVHLLSGLAGCKRIRYTHNGSEYAWRLPLSSPLIASPVEWAGRDVLLLVRDPADVLVSAYHHARFGQNRFEGTVSDFIREENTGIVKLLVAYNRWHENRFQAANFQVVSYEQMRQNPAKILRLSLQFAGLREIDPALIEDVVEFSSLENMRRYEQEGSFSGLRRKNVPSDGRKVREGRIGSAQELSAEDKQFIVDAIARLGNPFAHYCNGG